MSNWIAIPYQMSIEVESWWKISFIYLIERRIITKYSSKLIGKWNFDKSKCIHLYWLRGCECATSLFTLWTEEKYSFVWIPPRSMILSQPKYCFHIRKWMEYHARQSNIFTPANDTQFVHVASMFVHVCVWVQNKWCRDGDECVHNIQPSSTFNVLALGQSAIYLEPMAADCLSYEIVVFVGVIIR